MAGARTVSGLTAGVRFHADEGARSTVVTRAIAHEVQTVLRNAPQAGPSFGGVWLEVVPSTARLGTGPGGMSRHSREVFGDGCGHAVVHHAGFDLDIRTDADGTRVTARWRPDRQARILSVAMPARHRLLLAQTLVHYPALWHATTDSHPVAPVLPLAACVLIVDGQGVLITGPSGVGKSTLLARELAAGAAAVSDNLVVLAGDRTVHGVVEPLRADFALLPPGVAAQIPGRRTTHGRGEGHLLRREASVRVGTVVTLRRTGAKPGARPIDAGRAARELTAATYTAGELRRYWAFAAALSVATGRGPVHPPIAESTRRLCEAVPCLELELGPRPGALLRDILETDSSWT